MSGRRGVATGNSSIETLFPVGYTRQTALYAPPGLF